MKKVFALLAVAGMLTFGANNYANAQEGDSTATEEMVMDSTAAEEVVEEEMAEEPVTEMEAPA